MSFDDAVAAWGPSPAYGELGHGDKVKSSTTPKYVDDLQGALVHDVAMGAAHSLALIDTATDAGRAILAKLPAFSPPEPAPRTASAAKKRKAGADAKTGAAKRGRKPK